MKRKYYVALWLCLFFLTAFAQNKTTITGSVKDGAGEPLPGAGIVEKGIDYLLRTKLLRDSVLMEMQN